MLFEVNLTNDRERSRPTIHLRCKQVIEHGSYANRCFYQELEKYSDAAH
jgi:hypothetical protein